MTDPSGDDRGAGKLTYPTDGAFAPGIFDLVEVALAATAREVELRLTFARPLPDPWNARAWGGPGMSLHLVHVYLDTGRGGRRVALPGMGVRFGEGSGWERAIVVSAEDPRAVEGAVRRHAKVKRGEVIVARDVTVSGRTLVVRVPRRALVGGRPERWGVQVLVASTDPWAPAERLFTRAAGPRAAAFRFGGASAPGCTPSVVDLLSPNGGAQARWLEPGCREDGSPRATVEMVRPGS